MVDLQNVICMLLRESVCRWWVCALLNSHMHILVRIGLHHLCARVEFDFVEFVAHGSDDLVCVVRMGIHETHVDSFLPSPCVLLLGSPYIGPADAPFPVSPGEFGCVVCLPLRDVGPSPLCVTVFVPCCYLFRR